MLHFPLILLGYALVPLIAIRLMIRVDRPAGSMDQATFTQVDVL
jgi:hypothetical protein